MCRLRAPMSWRMSELPEASCCSIESRSLPHGRIQALDLVLRLDQGGQRAAYSAPGRRFVLVGEEEIDVAALMHSHWRVDLDGVPSSYFSVRPSILICWSRR